MDGNEKTLGKSTRASNIYNASNGIHYKLENAGIKTAKRFPDITNIYVINVTSKINLCIITPVVRC